MSLPKITTAKYECKLPISGKKVEYRPFLAKEEKILLMAAETKSGIEVFRAMREAVLSCTNDTVDVNTMSSIDLEWLFTHIRAKSVGESFEYGQECSNPDCSQKLEVVINLNDISIDGLEEFNKSKKIVVGGSIGIIMRPPTAKMAMKLSEETDQSTIMFDLIKDSIELVYEGEKTFKASETSNEDMDVFVDNIPSNVLKQISETLSKSPKMVANVDCTCPKCQTVNKIHVEGMGSFFS